MNDHHLDPPDYPEPPEWYMEIEELALDVRVPESVSQALHKALEAWCDEHNADQSPDPDCSEPEWENHYAVPTGKCSHGNPHTACDACDHLGDIAYDTARESQFSR